jgi:hypothetical protein
VAKSESEIARLEEKKDANPSIGQAQPRRSLRQASVSKMKTDPEGSLSRPL